MEEKIIEYAPIIIVVLGFIWQHNLFVKPETLEKLHREIIDEITLRFETKFVEINAYKEFQSHIYSELEKVSTGVERILKEFYKRDKDE